MAFNLPNGPLDMRKTTKGKGRTFRKTEEGAGMTKKESNNIEQKIQVVN